MSNLVVDDFQLATPRMYINESTENVSIFKNVFIIIITNLISLKKGLKLCL